MAVCNAIKLGRLNLSNLVESRCDLDVLADFGLVADGLQGTRLQLFDLFVLQLTDPLSQQLYLGVLLQSGYPLRVTKVRVLHCSRGRHHTQLRPRLLGLFPCLFQLGLHPADRTLEFFLALSELGLELFEVLLRLASH